MSAASCVTPVKGLHGRKAPVRKAAKGGAVPHCQRKCQLGQWTFSSQARTLHNLYKPREHHLPATVCNAGMLLELVLPWSHACSRRALKPLAHCKRAEAEFALQASFKHPHFFCYGHAGTSLDTVVCSPGLFSQQETGKVHEVLCECLELLFETGQHVLKRTRTGSISG